MDRPNWDARERRDGDLFDRTTVNRLRMSPEAPPRVVDPDDASDAPEDLRDSGPFWPWLLGQAMLLSVARGVARGLSRVAVKAGVEYDAAFWIVIVVLCVILPIVALVMMDDGGRRDPEEGESGRSGGFVALVLFSILVGGMILAQYQFSQSQAQLAETRSRDRGAGVIVPSGHRSVWDDGPTELWVIYDVPSGLPGGLAREVYFRRPAPGPFPRDYDLSYKRISHSASPW